MIVVTPPAAAARVADAKPSHSVRPGSLTCTWVSTSPGSSTSSSARSTIVAPSRAGRRTARPRRSVRPLTATVQAISAPSTIARRARTVRSRSVPVASSLLADRIPVVIAAPRPAVQVVHGDPGADPLEQWAGGVEGTPRGTTPRRSACTPHRSPRRRVSPRSSRHRPATATTGTPARREQPSATAGRRLAVQGLAVQGALAGDHQVRHRPGPPRARSARWTTSAPGRSDAPSTAMAPNPTPPAAPAPGVVAEVAARWLAATTSAHVVSAWSRDDDQVRIGALLRAVDRGSPGRTRSAGCRRRTRRRSSPSPGAGCSPARSSRRDLCPVRRRRPRARRRPRRGSRAPSARTMPAPPSVEALPPTPSRICGAAGVEGRGDHLSDAPARGGRRARACRPASRPSPHTSAISITASSPRRT